MSVITCIPQTSIPAPEPTVPACSIPETDSFDAIWTVFAVKCYGPEDHLGSTRMVIDDNEQIVEATEYSPYGMMSEVEANTTPLAVREKFTNKEFDEEGSGDGIGLYYLGSRYYDPVIGIFISPDPAEQYWYSYSYVGGDPINMVDPDGRMGLESANFALQMSSTAQQLSVQAAYIAQGIMTVEQAINSTFTAVSFSSALIKVTAEVTKQAFNWESLLAGMSNSLLNTIQDLFTPIESWQMELRAEDPELYNEHFGKQTPIEANVNTSTFEFQMGQDVGDLAQAAIAKKAAKGRLSGKNPPINKSRQTLHTSGTAGKSQFKPNVNAENVTRTAWEQGKPIFDKNGKFIGKIHTFKNPVGTSPTGYDQFSVKVHWSPTKGIHGVPTGVSP